MRRKIVLIVLCVLGVLYLQFGRTPTVNNSMTDCNPQGYEATLTITANKIGVWNKEALANHLIQQTIDNDFKNMQLSYDVLGYPNELRITVYANALTKYLDIPALKFRYSQGTSYQYNIKDNPEMFTLLYE